MDDISKVVEGLKKLQDEVAELFNQFSEAEINDKPNPTKWSKKEILGHLCDSGLNNLHRLIRVQYEEKPFLIDNQDLWVKFQDYQSMPIIQIIDLWKNLNQQLIRILNNFPVNRLESIIDVGDEVTARYIIIDYLAHQQHHLKQIFDMKQ
jgi:hypothetical protein